MTYTTISENLNVITQRLQVTTFQVQDSNMKDLNKLVPEILKTVHF